MLPLCPPTPRRPTPQPTVVCHVSLCLPLVRNVEHVAADVNTQPRVPVLLERLPTQTAPAADVQDEARFPGLRSIKGGSTKAATGDVASKATDEHMQIL